MYGAFFVKEFQQPIFLPSSVSLFDPKAPVPSPTRHSGKPSRAGAVKAGCLFGDHPGGLALTVPSTAAPSNAVGLGQQDDDQRGARVRARIYRATTLYSVGPRTSNHDAVMRIGSEAPKRRTHSLLRRDKPWSPSGQRHLEPSSATRHKRTGWAKTVGCLLRPPVIVRDAE